MIMMWKTEHNNLWENRITILSIIQFCVKPLKKGMLDFCTKQHMYTYMQTQKEHKRAINTMLKWVDCSVLEYHRFIELDVEKICQVKESVSLSNKIAAYCTFCSILPQYPTASHCLEFSRKQIKFHKINIFLMHLRTRKLSFCIDFMCHKCLELLLSPTNHEKGRHVNQVHLDCTRYYGKTCANSCKTPFDQQSSIPEIRKC